MDTVSEIAVKIIVDGIIISIIGLFFTRREKHIMTSIEEEFKKRDKFFDTRFQFKLRSLEELLAPVKLQLMRSKITLHGYKANDEYREKILKECNETIRRLLLENGYLIPSDLMQYAEEFLIHYDEWLQAYREARELRNITEIKHVYTHNFPHEAEKAFLKKFDEYRKELEIEGSLN